MSKQPTGGRILCVGEAMAELMLGNNESAQPSIGFAGDTLNTAIYLKRLLKEPSELSYVTAVGNDPLSSRLLNMISAESIDTSLINTSADRLLGLYAITTDESGERTFSYWRSQSAARTLFQNGNELDFSHLAEAEVVYFSAITLAILPASVRTAFIAELDRLRKKNNLIVVFDSNYRPALWESQGDAQKFVSDAWRITDIALPSVDDEQHLFGDDDEDGVVSRLRGYGISRGALKRGDRGPLSLAEHLETQSIELKFSTDKPVVVVDTTAAGDSFNAGYLSVILDGGDDRTALHAGHDCAMRVIGHSGAIIPLDEWTQAS